MKAVQFAEYGGPEVLRVVDVEEPHAGAGQIRVAVRAAGVNPIDWKIRSGAMSEVFPTKLPSIPGNDVAGVVDEVGDGVSGVAVGDEVFGNAISGAAAQYAVVDHFAAKPAGMSFAEAGGLGVAAETAARALDLLGLSAGQTVLINGAAGGVGITATQLAKARGANVIGTAGENNHAYLRSIGATPTTYGEGLADRVRELAPDGVDLALDTAGHGVLPDLIEITGSPDRVVTIADFSAPQYGVRVTTGAEGQERSFQALGQVAALHEEGRFSMPVAETFPLEQAGRAQQISQDGHVRGKLVLLVD
jgi:NADPH:quinone reductase-like Zn-dependent oxidoreductase